MSGKIIAFDRAHKPSALVLYTPLDRLALLKKPEDIPEIQQDIRQRKCHPIFADARLTTLSLPEIFEEDELRNKVNAHVYALDQGLLDQVWFYGGGVSQYTKLIANHALHRSTIVCFAPAESPQRKLLYEMSSTGVLAEVRG